MEVQLHEGLTSHQNTLAIWVIWTWLKPGGREGITASCYCWQHACSVTGCFSLTLTYDCCACRLWGRYTGTPSWQELWQPHRTEVSMSCQRECTSSRELNDAFVFNYQLAYRLKLGQQANTHRESHHPLYFQWPDSKLRESKPWYSDITELLLSDVCVCFRRGHELRSVPLSFSHLEGCWVSPLAPKCQFSPG